MNSGFLKRFCIVSLYKNFFAEIEVEIAVYINFVHFSKNPI